MRLFALLSGLLLLTACQSSNVVVDYDTATEFREFRTYSWQQQNSGAPEGVDPLMVERVKAAVAARLASYPMVPAVESQQPDLLVRYYLSHYVQSQESNTRAGIGFGSSGRSTGIGLSLSFPLGGERTVQEVQIVIDLISPLDRKVKWRGTNRVTLDTGSPEQITAGINAAVNEIFDRYPPQ